MGTNLTNSDSCGFVKIRGQLTNAQTPEPVRGLSPNGLWARRTFYRRSLRDTQNCDRFKMSSPPGEGGGTPLVPRLRLSRPATFWNRSRFAYSAITGFAYSAITREVATVRVFCRHRLEWTRLIIRSFREWHITDVSRDLLAFVAEPAKPKAQGERIHSALARSDDKSSRSQTARDEVACGKKKPPESVPRLLLSTN